jgi:hypothetical protein
MKKEDIQSLLKELEGIKKTESDIFRAYCVRFQKLLYQIPRSHHPEDKYLVYLYTNGLQVHLSFLLNKKKPKTFPEAHDMAIQIEKSLLMTMTDTMDTFSLIKLVSLGNFVEDSQERREQVSNQHDEDVIEEQEPKQDDEVSICAPPSDEAIQEPFSPAQQKEDEVSCFSSMDSNDTLFHDSESEEEMEALDEVDVPYCAIKDKEAIHDDEAITHAEKPNPSKPLHRKKQ